MGSIFDWFKSSSKKTDNDDIDQNVKKRKDFPGLILSLMKAKTYSGYYPRPNSELPAKDAKEKPPTKPKP